jgi:nucleotide-binding universal stress UspA family protein
VRVVRARREAPRRIVLAVDGSEDARAAVRVIETLPVPSSAAIELLRVEAAGEERLREMVVERARTVLGQRLVDVSTAAWDHAGESVLRHAVSVGADLIVLGVRGQTFGTGLLRTSIADHVLSHAHCAVLVAKSPVGARRLEVPVFAAAPAC